METTISLLDEQDMHSEDAYLALGYLTFQSKGVNISFFSDRYCMVFLTSTSLLAQCCELLSGKLKRFELVADGYGACLQLEKIKDSILISNADISVTVKASMFFSSLFTGFGAIVQNLKSTEVQSIDERFKDFFKYYSNFSALFLLSSKQY
jgi:hypothetical protein